MVNSKSFIFMFRGQPTTVIKKYGECCCRVRSNGKAGIFNTGSGASNLSNSAWKVSTCLVQSVGCDLRL